MQNKKQKQDPAKQSDAFDKFKRLQAGEHVITNDMELDAIEKEYGDEPCMGWLASLPNPNRVGLLDQYIAWIKPHKK